MCGCVYVCIYLHFLCMYTHNTPTHQHTNTYNTQTHTLLMQIVHPPEFLSRPPHVCPPLSPTFFLFMSFFVYICDMTPDSHVRYHSHDSEYDMREMDPQQYTSTHCNALHLTATYCNTLQHTATHTWFRTWLARNGWGSAARAWGAGMLQMCCGVLQKLQCVAVCCSVLQCVAVCCSGSVAQMWGSGTCVTWHASKSVARLMVCTQQAQHECIYKYIHEYIYVILTCTHICVSLSFDVLRKWVVWMSVIAHTQEHTAQQAQHDSLDSESRLAQFQSGVCVKSICVSNLLH